MNADKIRSSALYDKALNSANSGNSVTQTLELLLNEDHIKRKVNSGTGEWLVSLSLIIEQAHKDVSPIILRYKSFE